jgi:hypothetical protein
MPTDGSQENQRRLSDQLLSEAAFGRSVIVAHRGRLLLGCGFAR